MHDLFTEPYYAAATAPKRLPDSEAERRLAEILGTHARDTVIDTVKTWNISLRDAVRAVTALKFTDESGRVATAPVTVVDGMPKPLADATDHIEPWQWWLILHRPTLDQADHGLKLLSDHRDMLARHLGDTTAQMSAVEISRAFLDNLLRHSVEQDLLTRFKKIEEDVLGAYWIRASKIQLYWMPLAVFASLLKVQLTTLTIVVLCHELVHAYTHRGVDLNKTSWPTDRFVATDTFVKEGLAQYYTEQIMQGLAMRLPDGFATFAAKTDKQPAPYTAYRNWLGEKSQPSPEATRLAMLEFRNRTPPAFTHEEFVEILGRAHVQLQGLHMAVVETRS